MIHIKQNPIWLAVLFITTLSLAACVRPYPQDDPTAVPEADPGLVMTQPAVQPEQPLPTPVGESDSLPVATPVPGPGSSQVTFGRKTRAVI